jgi:DNA invertase Pin-like site-specific DNA recombinase
MEHIRSNGVALVLVERADRLARDLLVSEVLLAQFRDLGVRVVAADSGTDLTAADEEPTRVLIRQVLGAVSQFEKSVIVAKLRAARLRQRRQNGRCEGRKAFRDHPGEEVLHRIRQLHRKPRGHSRLSYGEIANQLNAERRPTRTGAPCGGRARCDGSCGGGLSRRERSRVRSGRGSCQSDHLPLRQTEMLGSRSNEKLLG